MKQTIRTGILLLLVAISSSAFAQTEKPKKAAWVPEKGYWVVESSNDLQHSIRFYTNENVLFYSEKLDGVKLKPAKRKVQLQLKEALESALMAWEQTREPSADKAWVKLALR